MYRLLTAVLVSLAAIAQAEDFPPKADSPDKEYALWESCLPKFGDLEDLMQPKVVTPRRLPLCSTDVFVGKTMAYLRKHLNFRNPTLFQRSFTAMRYALYKMGEKVSQLQKVDYESVYPDMFGLAQNGSDHPQLARDYCLKFWRTIEIEMGPIKNSVNNVLHCDPVIDREELLSCDKEVTGIVFSNGALQKTVQLYYEVGKTADIFYGLRGEFENVASLQREQRYLEYRGERLKPLIFELAALFKVLRGINL